MSSSARSFFGKRSGSKTSSQSFSNQGSGNVAALEKNESLKKLESAEVVNASGGINEVEALRSVFFKFFNIQTKGFNSKKKKTDIVSQEVHKFPINPFFDDTLQTFAE